MPNKVAVPPGVTRDCRTSRKAFELMMRGVSVLVIAAALMASAAPASAEPEPATPDPALATVAAVSYTHLTLPTKRIG